MLGAVKSDIVQDLSRVHVPTPEELAALEEERRRQIEAMRMQFDRHELGEEQEQSESGQASGQNITLTLGAVGENTEQAEHTAVGDIEDIAIPTGTNRNAPCPCGSGLKYKQCHGKVV